jgi:DNA-binding CsgD family transcriptional regulator/tetratricopeptide (TPR) repeat protein
VSELLEREDLLASLDAALEEGGRLVFVGGEAGVGKTSLVRAFAARANAPALRGSCENLTTPTPLGPFLDVGIDVDGDPRRVAAAVLDELDRTPLLVLEDVHWADQATLDVLRVLGRRVDATRGLVLATYRDDEVDDDHPLRLVLGELASTRTVSRLRVPPLSLAAVRELAEPLGADAEAIYRLTDGNAFYVTEILAADAEVLPETVRDAVLARISSLSRDARAVLDAVALVPARMELWLLDAVAPDGLPPLDECLAAGVLRADVDGVAFRHELARLVVESTVPLHRRTALHAAILAALEPLGDVPRLAHHAEGAGDSSAVLRYAIAAAEHAAAAGAHREAAAQYRRALRHGGRLPAQERVALLAAYGHESEVIGRYEDAIAFRLEAIALYRELGDRASEAGLLSHLTIPYIRAGRNEEAEDASARAIAMLESLPPGRELALAYADQAYARMLARDNADGVAWGERAVAAARAQDDPDVLSFGLNMVGTSYVMAGEIEHGIASLLESLEVARREGLEVRIVSALGMLGSGLGEMYELERAESYLRECIEFSEQREYTTWYPRSWLALVETYTGRWDDGAARALAVLAGPSDPISRISANVALGRVRSRRGDPGAREVLEEALRESQPGGHLQRLGHVRAARAEAAWLAGDEELAAAEARAAYALALEKRHLWFAGELAYWQWRAGALDEAPAWIAEPYRLQLDGDAAGAAEEWRRRGCRYEAARTLADAGDEAAVPELEALGARPAAAQLRRRLGIRGPRAATRNNPAGLTPRELDVLSLLAQGLRNGEIAERLHLSTRTVDHHVSAILRKLPARSRAEATAFAVQLGLGETR